MIFKIILFSVCISSWHPTGVPHKNGSWLFTLLLSSQRREKMRQSNSQFHLAWRSFGSLLCFGSNTKTRMIQHILQWSIQCFHGVSSAFMEPRNNCGDKAASNSITIQYCYPEPYWLWLNRNGHGLMLASTRMHIEQPNHDRPGRPTRPTG